MFGTAIHTKKIIFFASKTDAFVFFGTEWLREVAISGMDPIWAEFCTETTGDAVGIPSDGVFPNGVAKPGRGFDHVWKLECILFIHHGALPIMQGMSLFVHRKWVQNFPFPNRRTTWSVQPHLEAA